MNDILGRVGPWIQDRFRRFGLPTWFAVLGISNIWVGVEHGWVGLDFRIYRQAAIYALHGLNPYAAGAGGFRYDAPPPTTLFYLPLAVLPEAVGAVVCASLCLLGAAYTLRRLKLPAYWVLFPPIAESLVTLNPDIVVIALLLAPGWVAALAPVLKIYSAIPLVWAGRIRLAIAALVLMIASAPLWPDYLADLSARTSVLGQQSNDYSAWGTWLLIPALGALYLLRRRGGGWLAVPTVWPYTQLHYACIALPAFVRRPWLAAAMSVGIPLLTPLTVIVTAGVEALRGQRDHATDAWTQ